MHFSSAITSLSCYFVVLINELLSGVVLLDLRKAFHLVNQTVLLDIMVNLQFTVTTIGKIKFIFNKVIVNK